MRFLDIDQYTQFGVDHAEEIHAAAVRGDQRALQVAYALDDMGDGDDVPLQKDLNYAAALHGYIQKHYPEMLR